MFFTFFIPCIAIYICYRLDQQMHTISYLNLQNSYFFRASLAFHHEVLGHNIISSIIVRGEHVNNGWSVHTPIYRLFRLLCAYSPLYIRHWWSHHSSVYWRWQHGLAIVLCSCIPWWWVNGPETSRSFVNSKIKLCVFFCSNLYQFLARVWVKIYLVN